MTKLPRSQKKLSDLYERANQRCYRQILGEGTNFWKFKVVDPKRVKAFTKISIEKCTWTDYNWTYRDAEFHYHVSRKHSLPIECDGIVNLTSKLVGTRIVAVTVKRGRKIINSHAKTVQVHKATWVAQGKGTNVRAEKGFIAKLGDLYYHGDSFEQVVKGIVRKNQAEYERIAREKEQRKTESLNLKQFIAAIPEKLKLSYNDSIAVGNCAKGTRNFINRHSLDKSKKYPARVIMRLARGTANELNVRRIIEYKMHKKLPASGSFYDPQLPIGTPSTAPAKRSITEWIKQTFLGSRTQAA